MPNVPMVMMKSSTVNVIVTILVTNDDNVFSVCFRSKILCRTFFTLFISHAPIAYITIAANTLIPNAMAS